MRALIGALPAGGRADHYAHMAVHPYPSHLMRQWTTSNGAVVQIRPIRPEDAQMERAFVRALSDEARYFRFISAMRELPDRMLARFTQIDYDREMALVAVTRPAGREVQIGVARYAIGSDGESCEFAIVVADAWQGQGVGSRLMAALMEAARNKGLKRIEGHVLHNNVKMLALMHKLGFDVRADPEDPALKRVARSLLPA